MPWVLFNSSQNLFFFGSATTLLWRWMIYIHLNSNLKVAHMYVQLCIYTIHVYSAWRQIRMVSSFPFSPKHMFEIRNFSLFTLLCLMFVCVVFFFSFGGNDPIGINISFWIGFPVELITFYRNTLNNDEKNLT